MACNNSSFSLSSESWTSEIEVWGGWVSVEAVSHLLSRFWWLLQSLALLDLQTPLQPSAPLSSHAFPCVCLSLLIMTGPLDLRLLINPAWSHLDVLHSVTYAKNQHQGWGMRHSFWEITVQPSTITIFILLCTLLFSFYQCDFLIESFKWEKLLHFWAMFTIP